MAFNAFHGDEMENPFSKPNSELSGRINDSTLNTYNPFSSPAILPAENLDTETMESNIKAPSTFGQRIPISSEELAQRERILEERDRELRQREEDLRKAELNQDKAHNWPSLPSFLPVKPCFYLDIDLEIGVENQRIVRFGYHLWMLHCAGFLWNIVAAVAYLAGCSTDSKSVAASTFGLSVIWAVVFVPASFVGWFRPLYKAFRNNSSFNFFVFFLLFGVQIFILFTQGLGINYWAGCGWINGISTMANNTAAGIVMLMSAVLFTCLVVVDILLLIRVHRIYRGSGASFEKAKQEFSHSVVSNPGMQSAASEALRTNLSSRY